jgi:hypothetical protein
MGSKCTRFTIQLITSPNTLVGFAPITREKESSQYTSSGYYFHTFNGLLYGQDKTFEKPYHEKCNQNRTIVEAILENGTISYSVNGKHLGIAFKNVVGDLYPCIELGTKSSVLEFIN